jgi:hypothetical protein
MSQFFKETLLSMLHEKKHYCHWEVSISASISALFWLTSVNSATFKPFSAKYVYALNIFHITKNSGQKNCLAIIKTL